MKAIVQNEYGSPDVFELKEIDKPVVKDDGVLVSVHAVALHAGGYFTMRGVPYLVRMIAGWPKQKNHVPGYDVAIQSCQPQADERPFSSPPERGV